MRMKLRMLAGAMVAGAALAGPATATISTISWKGTLDAGSSYTIDNNASVDIGGRVFTVAYTVDDSLGIDNSMPPTLASVSGGPVFGSATSPVTAVVTLDGLGSFTLSGNNFSTASRVDVAPGASTQDAASFDSADQIDEVVGGVDHHRTSFVRSFLSETDPALYGTLFDSIAYGAGPIRDRAASDVSAFTFQWNDIQTSLTMDQRSQLFVSASSSSNFIVSTSAVPEPSSWALMITGFGMLGTAMRRRRSLGIA